ncbi:MAG: hypothetical protein CMC96_14565 [Flavobacteriales bacterium]|nr:hypothetical protein [Flavobacteriales bacterium]|tara:strand:- start:10142 stop:10882 length:741 start_codon:yes stop_codon:yes gene_type:complete
MSSERQEINRDTPWWGEHLHRYMEVIKRLEGNEKILDLACGSGYGSNILADSTSALVIGGDISKSTIEDCKKHWTKDNLDFLELNGAELNFPSNTFDLIVSFETIEHTESYNQMIVEFKRVVKKGGSIFLSTPNKKINSPNGVIVNPFHTQEWYFDEFYSLLENYFQDFELFGQQYSRYSNRKSLAYALEKFFYLRGVRKLPLMIKNSVFKLLGFESFYPLSNDFSLVSDKDKVKACKTFFAICKV